MPIDRPDGRHWCAPEFETPDEHGTWTCPGCQQVWVYRADSRVSHWILEEDLEVETTALALVPDLPDEPEDD